MKHFIKKSKKRQHTRRTRHGLLSNTHSILFATKKDRRVNREEKNTVAYKKKKCEDNNVE